MTVNIDDRASLEAGVSPAAEASATVMVERYLPGNDFRLLVVGDKLVAAARRDPPHVVGDGVTPCASWSNTSTPTRAAATATPRR